MIPSNPVDTSTRKGSAPCVLFAVTSEGISRSVLRKAAHLPAALDAQLELFCCAFDSEIIRPGRISSLTPEESIQQYMEQRQQHLWSLAEDLRTTGLSVYSVVEWDRRTDEGIVREVLRRQATLLVVESFPGSPQNTLAESKLIATCPCPLLLVRSALPYPAHPRIVAAVDPMHAYAKPAGLDDAIVAAASNISSALSGELHLFHARAPWASVFHQTCGPLGVPDVVKVESQASYEHDVAARVAQIAQRHAIPSLRTHLVEGSVTECLPTFSRIDSADIVAMGALSRSLIQRVLIGDTARRLLNDLECDVLIVKQPGFQTTVT